MTVYAVHYSYPDDMAEMLQHRPEHRAFLSSCEGLVLAGALGEEYLCVDAEGNEPEQPNGGLLVLEAESLDALSDLLDQDPYFTGGFLECRTIRAWNPPLGRLAQS